MNSDTQIKVKLLREGAILPKYQTTGAAGFDLHACINGDAVIQSGETVFVNTGIAVAIPFGYAGFVFARSGLSCKQGLAPANKVGVIDSDYRGEVTVALLNHSASTKTVRNGDRIAQLVIMPVLCAKLVQSQELDDTTRGSGGFGSTGGALV